MLIDLAASAFGLLMGAGFAMRHRRQRRGREKEEREVNQLHAKWDITVRLLREAERKNEWERNENRKLRLRLAEAQSRIHFLKREEAV